MRGMLGWAGSPKTADPKPSSVAEELRDPRRALPSGGHVAQRESPWVPDPALPTGWVTLGVSLPLSSRPALMPLNCKTSVSDTQRRGCPHLSERSLRPSFSWLLCPNLEATLGTSTSSPLISNISQVQSSKRTHPLSPLTPLPPYRDNPTPPCTGNLDHRSLLPGHSTSTHPLQHNYYFFKIQFCSCPSPA